MNGWMERLDQVFMVSHHGHKTIAPMEGIRGLAAFMVFVVHFAAQSLAWIPADSLTSQIIFYLRFLGATGVDLFFVLSGFLIYGMLLKKQVTYAIYAKRRIRRIYPVFLFVMILYLVLSYAFPSESKLPGNLADTLFYFIACLLLLPGIFPIEPVMTVAWTLSYEAFFYLALPLVIAGLRLRDRSSNERILVLIAFAVFLFALNVFYNFHLHMVMFVSGMLVFELTQLNLKLRWLLASWMLPATLVLMLATRYWFYHTYEWPVALIMFFGYGLVCYDVFRGASRLAGFFALPMMRWYGNMSYSYYLIHGLALKFLFLALGLLFLPNKADEWVFYALFVPFFLVTLCVSAVLFVVVEKPLSFARRVEAPRVSVRFD